MLLCWESEQLYLICSGPPWHHQLYRCFPLYTTFKGKYSPTAEQHSCTMYIVFVEEPTVLWGFWNPLLQNIFWFPISVWNPVSSQLNMFWGLLVRSNRVSTDVILSKNHLWLLDCRHMPCWQGAVGLHVVSDHFSVSETHTSSQCPVFHFYTYDLHSSDNRALYSEQLLCQFKSPGYCYADFSPHRPVLLYGLWLDRNSCVL